jgi:hypothetical protein
MRFVSTLTTDAKTITNPTWTQVEREVNALDARTRTLVMLAPSPPKGPPEGDHHLAIGGGADGRFVVYTTEDNSNFWNLTDVHKRADDRKVRMVVGGQEGEYQEAQLVSLGVALAAARRYMEDGQRAPELNWSEG